MNNRELSNQFDTLVNSYRRFRDFDKQEMPDTIEFDEYEKSLYLTKAQEELVVSLYNGKNTSGESFEQTEEQRRILSSLIKEAELSPIETSNGMPLGIDATILYVHPEHEGAPTAAMLAEDSPYNTRDRVGLPPTPICSPGLASIKAALNPASTSYYYYALDEETGTHRFFINSYEFDEFVASQGYGA